jgi:hypothetical protein
VHTLRAYACWAEPVKRTPSLMPEMCRTGLIALALISLTIAFAALVIRGVTPDAVKQRTRLGKVTPLNGARVLFHITDQPVFNVAFMKTRGKWVGIARWYSGPSNSMPPLMCSPMSKWSTMSSSLGFRSGSQMSQLAFSSDIATEAFKTLTLPSEVHCENTGEPKWAGPALPDYVYGYMNDFTHGMCTKFGDLPKVWERYWGTHGFDARSEVALNYMRNYQRGFLFKANASALVQQSPVLLSYKRRPEERDVAKNFLFFRAHAATFLIALFNPHVIYQMNVSSGLLIHAHQTVFRPRFNYARIGLSAGPVRWNATTFIAAAHESRGGWADAYRMTIFYLFSSIPPFRVLCSTPTISFGFSATLEYCTSLQLSNAHLFIGFGYDNCHSALLAYPVAKILSQCQ